MASFSKQLEVFYENSILIFALIGEKLSQYIFSSHRVEPATVTLINCHAVKLWSKYFSVNT